jgi:hypothetical protein
VRAKLHKVEKDEGGGGSRFANRCRTMIDDGVRHRYLVSSTVHEPHFAWPHAWHDTCQVPIGPSPHCEQCHTKVFPPSVGTSWVCERE